MTATVSTAPVAGMAPAGPVLSGATRVHYIVGDPIAQVKSPAGVTQALVQRGHDAVVVPAHVRSADLAAWLAGVSLARNVDGIIVTVPHKFDAFALCASTSPAAAFLRSVNTLRRRPDGRWHGDMFDGTAMVAALQAQGVAVAGQRCLLVGAGGAGTAIAHALVMAGAARLAIHDADTVRRDALVQRLASLQRCPVDVGSDDPAGAGIVVNATPAGMQPGDALPLRVDGLQRGTAVACVVTAPAVTALVAEARRRGCTTVTGSQMFAQVRDRMVEFLLTPHHAGAEAACS